MSAAAGIERHQWTAGLVGTSLVHVVMLGFLVIAARQQAIQSPVYAVNLVAAPAPTETARKVAEEAPPRPVERTAPVDPPTRSAVKPPPPTKAPAKQTEAPVQTRSTETPAPGETPSTGRDVANVSTPGVEFPYPEYLRRIVNEIYRRWQRPAGSTAVRTQISFLILRDGTVMDVKIERRSANYSFDLSALGAVEAAANSRAFGPLPDGFQGNALAVAFWFEPRQAP